MPATLSKPHFEPKPAPRSGISKVESAHYTSDLLEALRKIACGQGQTLLAHLLELARVEARALIRDDQPGR